MVLIAAVSTAGRVFYAMHRKNNNTNSLVLFYQHLIEHLKNQDSHYKDNTYFVHDNAPYATSRKFTNWANKTGLSFFQFGPYSFSHSGAEAIFAYCKKGLLHKNPTHPK